MNQETIHRVALWLTGDDTGASSKFLAALIVNKPNPEINYPHDPADFGRCYRLLGLLSDEEKKQVLFWASNRSEKWKSLVEHWEQAVKLFEEEWPTGRAPKLYDLMKEIGL